MAGPKIIALVGDYYHAPEGMTAALSHAAQSMGGSLEVITDPEKLPWDALAGFQALVMAKENRIAPASSTAVWASEEREAAIATFAAAGGAVIALHNGLASYDEKGQYFATVRGSFQYHPKEHPRFKVHATTVDHPVLAGFRPFELTDEMYFVRVDSAHTTKLLELSHPDYGSSCASWVHEVGRGRVFCFTPGHTAEVLNDPGWQAVLARGLRWALRLS
jgi:type 1 glutamine amidotransferase